MNPTVTLQIHQSISLMLIGMQDSFASLEEQVEDNCDGVGFDANALAQSCANEVLSLDSVRNALVSGYNQLQFAIEHEQCLLASGVFGSQGNAALTVDIGKLQASQAQVAAYDNTVSTVENDAGNDLNAVCEVAICGNNPYWQAGEGILAGAAIVTCVLDPFCAVVGVASTLTLAGGITFSIDQWNKVTVTDPDQYSNLP